jgi:hypothetical protein
VSANRRIDARTNRRIDAANRRLLVLGRRAALRSLLAAAGAGAAARARSGEARAAPSLRLPVAARPLDDPNMLEPTVPWKRLLTRDELRTLAVLCDVLLPGDERSPAASKLGIHEFLDEWVSAPYPTQEEDRTTIRGGLTWLDAESGRRSGKRFVDLGEVQRHQICDDIASVRKARTRFRTAARFFHRLRFVALLGYYTTLEGMNDIGYGGNKPLQSWDGPSQAVRRHLKLG